MIYIYIQTSRLLLSNCQASGRKCDVFSDRFDDCGAGWSEKATDRFRFPSPTMQADDPRMRLKSV